MNQTKTWQKRLFSFFLEMLIMIAYTPLDGFRFYADAANGTITEAEKADGQYFGFSPTYSNDYSAFDTFTAAIDSSYIKINGQDYTENMTVKNGDTIEFAYNWDTGIFVNEQLEYGFNKPFKLRFDPAMTNALIDNSFEAISR